MLIRQLREEDEVDLFDAVRSATMEYLVDGVKSTCVRRVMTQHVVRMPIAYGDWIVDSLGCGRMFEVDWYGNTVLTDVVPWSLFMDPRWQSAQVQ